MTESRLLLISSNDMMNYKIDIQNLLPVHKDGSENDALAILICNSETAAFYYFRSLSEKLLKINEWKMNSGKNPTEFFIHNKDAQDERLLAKENDLVKIKMPAPKNKLGSGFDWVTINKLETVETAKMKAFLLQMKPHSCPESADGSIAHFYTHDATNTFILAKENNTIQFSIHGRNEIPNTKKIGFMNSCRNILVAGGGIFGGSKLQWQDFAEEFIKNEN